MYKIKYTKEYLEKLDMQLEMVPLTLDCVFKKIFETNLEMLKKFLIIVLKLNINPNECKIEMKNSELPKYNHKEYKMILDVHTILDNNIYVDVEMNSEYFKDIKERNSFYLDKRHVSLLEVGNNPKDYDEIYLYQLNLNTREKKVTHGEHIIVPYDLTTKSVFADNKIMILKYLEYYQKLYYTYGNRDKEVIWLSGLTSKTFVELYDIFSQLLTPKELDKLLGDMINMSKDEFILHEWEKEKLDALVEYTKEKNRRQEYEEELQEAVEEAVQEAVEETTETERINIAKSMIEHNMDTHIISDITKLSVEKIESLK